MERQENSKTRHCQIAGSKHGEYRTMEPLDSQFVRALLTTWARWLLRSNGYARLSSCAVLLDGGSGGMPFCSRPPSGALPGAIAERASIAMQRLRDSDPALAGILEAWYLRKNETAITLAKNHGMAVGQFHSLRKCAERKFGDIYFGLMECD